MRKNLICVLLVLSLSALTAFASGNSEQAAATGAPSGTVDFVNVWGGTRVPLMDKIIKEFEQQHPMITINSELIPQSGMNERYLTSIASGTPADVIMLNRNQLPYFASQNALTSLDSYLKRDGMDMSKIYYDAEAKLSQWKGVTYALPNATATGWALLFWNKTMFKEAGLDPNKGPQTWQDISALNDKFRKTSNGDVRQVGLPPESDPAAFYTKWLGADNGQFLRDDLKKLAIDSPESKATLTWVYGELKKVGGIDKLTSFYDYAAPNDTSTQARTAFYNGKAAMLLDGVWMFYQIPQEAPKGFDYGVTTIPYNGNNPNARSSVLVDGGWGYSIPHGAKHADAAWEWLKFACAGQGSKEFFQGQTRPTPIVEANQDKWYYDNNPYWNVVIKDAENATFSQPLPVSPEIKTAINNAIEPVLYGKTTIDAGLAAAQSAGQKILSDYWAKQH